MLKLKEPGWLKNLLRLRKSKGRLLKLLILCKKWRSVFLLSVDDHFHIFWFVSGIFGDIFMLQVETFGAMAKTEKIAFILEQVWTRNYFSLR